MLVDTPSPPPPRVAIIDGLRGMAVIFVMASHFGLPVPSGGLVGVTMFFVISGYLITKSLCGSATSITSISSFWIRRFFRIAPALVVLVALVTIWDSQAVDVPELRNAFDILTLQANFVRADGEGLGHMGHLWSLALEEQFYILLPLTAIILLKFGRLSLLAKILIATAVLSTLFRFLAWLLGTDPAFIEFSPWTRCDALASGCVLALTEMASQRGNPTHALRFINMRWLVLGLFGLSLVSNASLQFTAVITLTTVLAAVLMVNGQGLAQESSAWTIPWLTFTGRISYGLYLWHVPVVSGVQERLEVHLSVQILAMILLSYMMATMSFYVIEAPSMRVGRKLAANRAEKAAKQ